MLVVQTAGAKLEFRPVARVERVFVGRRVEVEGSVIDTGVVLVSEALQMLVGLLLVLLLVMLVGVLVQMEVPIDGGVSRADAMAVVVGTQVLRGPSPAV